MIFEITFNYPDDKNNTEEFYEFIGAKWAGLSPNVGDYEIELNSFEELAKLMLKINQKYYGRDSGYSPILDFEKWGGTIYLDDKF